MFSRSLEICLELRSTNRYPSDLNWQVERGLRNVKRKFVSILLEIKLLVFEIWIII